MGGRAPVFANRFRLVLPYYAAGIAAISICGALPLAADRPMTMGVASSNPCVCMIPEARLDASRQESVQL